jgi:phosphatidylglycerophosphate synthase
MKVDVSNEVGASLDAGPSLGEFLAGDFSVGGPLLTRSVMQPAGGSIAFAALRLRLTPNLLTVAGLLIGLAGSAGLAGARSSSEAAAAAAVLVVSYLFDCADGQLARAQHTSSTLGATLDVVCDGVLVVATALAVLPHVSGTIGQLAVAALALGRTLSLVAATAARRTAGYQRWSAITSARWARTSVVAAIDTPVVYLALATAVVLHGPVAAVAALLGCAAAAHAGLVGSRAVSFHR